jgi:methionyl-tRNA synthetase
MAEFVLPENVPANQFLNLEGRKLSTSKNWAVWVHEYCAEFAGQEDVLRYNMIKKMPEQSDSEFTWKGFQETNNNELVNNLANFVNRVLVLSHKYYAGVVPTIDPNITFKSGWETDTTGQYNDELRLLHNKLQEMGAAIERYELREALRILMEISSAGNALLQFNEPWKTVKEAPEMVKVVMNLAIQYVAVLSVAVRPFIPFSSDRLRKMLHLNPLQDNGDLLQILHQLENGNPVVPAEHALNEPEHLFSRIPDEVIEQQIAKLGGTVDGTGLTVDGGQTSVNSEQESAASTTAHPVAATEYRPMAETIQFDDFAKLDLRTGTILTAEKMEKSKKLLKLSVDLGFETRTILSGIAEHFTPDQVIGQQVVIVANLAPRVMMGIESQGMILMADNPEGKLSFVSPSAGWPSGMGVK